MKILETSFFGGLLTVCERQIYAYLVMYCCREMEN